MQPEPAQFTTIESTPATTEVRIKGSRFIGEVFHIETEEEFRLYYQQLKKKYLKADHYCYAYRLSAELYRYHDNGEPRGTAGRPIYHVLSEKNLFQILLVVVRYFGGTKLGRNGLVRAYTRSAQETLQQAKKVFGNLYKTIHLQLPYTRVPDVLYLVRESGGRVRQTDYQDRVRIQAQIPVDRFAVFSEQIGLLAKRGELSVELVENSAS